MMYKLGSQNSLWKLSNVFVHAMYHESNSNTNNVIGKVKSFHFSLSIIYE
jgi:hypothetical protein